MAFQLFSLWQYKVNLRPSCDVGGGRVLGSVL